MTDTSLPGPPRVKNDQGHARLKPSKKTYTVTLDAGAFWAVWETIEAKAKKWDQGPGANHLHNPYAPFRRAAVVFREVYYTDHPDELPPPPPLPKKVVVRRTPVKNGK